VKGINSDAVVEPMQKHLSEVIEFILRKLFTPEGLKNNIASNFFEIFFGVRTVLFS
jgi:hypothetical protein